MDEQLLSRIDIVLVRPEGSGNVGAACRAMKSMGLSNLVIVDSPNLDRNTIKTWAVHADDVWERALHFPDLKTALAKAAFTAGTTRRRGKLRKYFTLLPEELAERISRIREGRIAIVFGNEVHGLTDAELAECGIAVTIPTSPAFPSLNLSHAVQIVAYELFRAAHPTGPYTPIEKETLDSLVTSIADSLGRLGFFMIAGREDMERFLRDILARAGLSRNEARRFEGIFTKAEQLAGKRKPPDSL